MIPKPVRACPRHRLSGARINSTPGSETLRQQSSFGISWTCVRALFLFVSYSSASPALHHLLAVMRGEASAETPGETAWLKFRQKHSELARGIR